MGVMPASLQLGQQHMSQLLFIANDPCESLHSHPALPVLLRSDNEHMNVGLLHYSPVLATGGCSDPFQDTAACLLYCEWLRPILHPGDGQITHPTCPLCSAPANLLSTTSLQTGPSKCSTKSCLTVCCPGFCQKSLCIMSELWLHLLDKNCELKYAKKEGLQSW